APPRRGPLSVVTEAGAVERFLYTCLSDTPESARFAIMTDQPNPKFTPLSDFALAMCAGMGLTRCRDTPDTRGIKFDENLKSGEFSKSGLEGVATTLMENV